MGTRRHYTSDLFVVTLSQQVIKVNACPRVVAPTATIDWELLLADLTPTHNLSIIEADRPACRAEKASL